MKKRIDKEFVGLCCTLIILVILFLYFQRSDSIRVCDSVNGSYQQVITYTSPPMIDVVEIQYFTISGKYLGSTCSGMCISDKIEEVGSLSNCEPLNGLQQYLFKLFKMLSGIVY